MSATAEPKQQGGEDYEGTFHGFQLFTISQMDSEYPLFLKSRSEKSGSLPKWEGFATAFGFSFSPRRREVAAKSAKQSGCPGALSGFLSALAVNGFESGQVVFHREGAKWPQSPQSKAGALAVSFPS